MTARTLPQIADSAKERGDHDLAGVMRHLANGSDLLAALPFIDILGSSYTYYRAGLLDSVDNLKTISAKAQVERLRIVGSSGFRGFGETNNVFNLDVDCALIATHGSTIRDQQERMKLRAKAYDLTDKLVNGDSESNVREFDGLKRRIIGRQLIAAGTSAQGDALRTSVLNKAIDAVEEPTHLLMSRKMRDLLVGKDAVSDGHAFYRWTEVVGGKTVERSLPILTTTYNLCNGQVIDFNEQCPGGLGKGTSIYVLNLSDSGVCGLQNSNVQVRDFGELESAQVLRKRVLWLISLAILSGRAAARVWGIADAPVIADAHSIQVQSTDDFHRYLGMSGKPEV